MKRFLSGTLMVLALFGVTGCTVSVSRFAIPIDTEVIQLGVGAKLTEWHDSATHVRLSPLWVDDDYIQGVNVSAISSCYATDGVAIGGLLHAHRGAGVSAALVDYNENHKGVRLGLFVCGGRQDGVQIGLINTCSDASHVLQIGLLNWAGEGESPRFLFNGSWGENKKPTAPAYE